jgi:hypothetical protein
MSESSLKEFYFPEPDSHTGIHDTLIDGALTSDDARVACLEKLEGYVLKNYIPAYVTEAIITFGYKGFEFSADNAYMRWSFWVDKSCPDQVISEIKAHLRKSLRK